MENVVAFNNELSGLYESKPPISKAKMAAITRAAMRAIKFYKHVVQSVEKFILKCKSEYKVPGLYVIDSIVRQSRHQYGPEKDVFAPRFARNMKETFANLFRCAPEDKSRIIRVLNLWQKNNVFAPDVIQPIFDLADPNHPIYSMPPPVTATSSAGPSGSVNLNISDISSSQANGGLNTSTSSMDISLGAPAIPQQEEKLPASGLADLSNNNLKQLLNDPNVLRQLQTLQNFTKFKQEDKQHNMRLQEEAFEKHLQNVLKNTATTSSSSVSQPEVSNDFNKEVEFVSEEQKIEVINLDANDSRSPTPDRDRYKRRRSRSRSRSRDRGGRSRRGRSRSRSRSRSPRSNRRRTSRDRERSNRDKERDREHERERRKKGLPEIKKDHLSVCSTTLWVGHLSKLVYQEELSDTFGEYGDIVSIDQIVPRGCAFIVMNRRQDAYKAMQGLKNHKLQGRAITISWAAGKGVKSKEWKDFWDLELGVTYIPWSKLDESTDFDTLEEGGMFDEDSMPGWMKEKISKLKSLKESANEQTNNLLSAGGMTGPPPTLPPSGNPGIVFGIDTTQPPPGPPPTGGPPPMLPMVPGQFSMAPPMTGPPRMLPPPHMGMPLSGIHMPPNIVPPHAMMMMPGFGSGGGPPMGPPHIPPMGGPHSAQFPPPAGPSATAMPSNVSNDDQMDIEMEDEEGATLAAANIPASSTATTINFSQPPPSFGGSSASGVEKSVPITGEPFSRDRNRSGGGAGSRWGGRGTGSGPDDDGNDSRWRENGGAMPQGGPHNFPDVGQRNVVGPPHRPDFMNDFDKRGGPGPRGGGGGPNFNGGGNDFHPNMQNRFNQPTNLMQMRIPPPNAFNQRGGPGGGPMFMRGGQGGPGGGGGRHQGPGFFNRNNPFDRDISEGFGGRGRGRGRGGGRGGRGGGFGGGRDNMQGSGSQHGGNWSDEEADEGGFKRRGGNRFRDREGSSDRFNMRDNNRGGRRGPGGPQRDRNDNERDNRGGRGFLVDLGGGGARRMSREDNNKKKPHISDTEEDWDRELKDYETKNDKKDQKPFVKFSQNFSSNTKTNENETEKTTSEAFNMEKPAFFLNDKNPESKDSKENKDTKESISNTLNTAIDDTNKNTKSATPLYDELPPPKATVVNKPENDATAPAVVEKTTPAAAPPTQSPKPVALEPTACNTPAKMFGQPLDNLSIKETVETATSSISESISGISVDDNKPENAVTEA